MLLLIVWINAFVFLYLSLVFEGPRTGYVSKSAWTVQYLGCTRDSHVFFFNSATPSLAVPVIIAHMLNLISGVMK